MSTYFEKITCPLILKWHVNGKHVDVNGKHVNGSAICSFFFVVRMQQCGQLHRWRADLAQKHQIQDATEVKYRKFSKLPHSGFCCRG